MHEGLLKIKKYAQNHHVPIIYDEGLLVLYDYLKKYEQPKVLEIGSAIGYSAIAMALKGASVYTIERDLDMYEIAVVNIKENNLSDQITIINQDALEDIHFNVMFDIIFIDAAKSQYQTFFKLYEKYLQPDGVILCDNLNFHNLNPNEVSRSTRQLLRKINDFKIFLSNNQNYETTFLNVGDGLSLSRKK